MTTTDKVRRLDTDDLTARVQAMYTQVADEPDHPFHFETGRALALRLGYPVTDLDLAAITAGDLILDLGSGSGTDSFAAAAHTGPTGKVIGVDMTPAQLHKARRVAAAAGRTNLEFREGRIEAPPVVPGTVDCIISNGVVNLSPDKTAVFRAAAAALRPDGRLALADIVTRTPLPAGVTCDAALWAACIGGAAQRDEYLAAIESAGFTIDTVRDNPEYTFVSERAVGAMETFGVTSISLLARRA